MGPVGHDRLADWYRAADLTVLCSKSEGLPNVLREAVACGTPFVSTDVGSIREIAEPQYAELVAMNSPMAFAEGIRTVLNGTHAAAAKQFIPRTWAETARDTVALFNELIASRSSQRKQPLSLEPSSPSH
jgi:glycosyltransferase involved in cell wall biosynthesis